MTYFTKAALLCLLATTSTEAFVVSPHAARKPLSTKAIRQSTAPSLGTNTQQFRHLQTRLFDTKEESKTKDDEIQRLKAMAAKLRAEAAALEAEKMEAMAAAAEKAFQTFDTNKDGEISLTELKEGLEKALKVDLTESRVEALMDAFDSTGDKVLKVNEFVTVDQFRNKLEALAREEREAAIAAEKEARKEKDEALLAEAKLSILNDKEPTNTDKLVSIIPYLFPLMDGLMFGRFLLEGNEGNPFVAIVAILYTLYRSIPFQGFVAFLALNFLSSNPSLNRLVRFNMQQAIFLDIALFFPGLIGGLYGIISQASNVQLASSVTELGTDAVFVALLAVLGYCSVSSLLGIAPNKVPFISKAVEDRMISVDMFDDEGRFIPREMRDDKDDEKKDK